MIDKYQSKNDISWVAGLDFCFAYVEGKQLDKLL